MENKKLYNDISENVEDTTTEGNPDSGTDDTTTEGNPDSGTDDTTTEVTEDLKTNVDMDHPNDSYLVVLKKIADSLWKKKGKEDYQNRSDNRLDALIEIKEALRGKTIEDCTTDEEKLEYLKNQPVTIMQGLISILNAINEEDDNFNNVNYPEDYVPTLPAKFSLYDALIDGDAFKDTDYQEGIRIFPDGCMLGNLYRKTYDELDSEGQPTGKKLNGYALSINISTLDSTIDAISIFALRVDEHCQTINSTDTSLELILNKMEFDINGGNKNTEICINAYDVNNELLDCLVLSMRNLKLSRDPKPTEETV